MKHNAVRRVPEFVYAFLTLTMFSAIGLAIWGAVAVSNDAIQEQLRVQREPKQRKKIEEITKTIVADADNPQKRYWDHVERGDLYMTIDAFEGATSDFDAAHDLASSRWQERYALLRLAKAASARGDSAKARASLDGAIAVSRSSDPSGYLARASFFRRQHDNSAALADLDAAITLAPEAYETRLDRLLVLARSGRLGEAGTAFGRIVQMIGTEREADRLAQESDEASAKGDFKGALVKQTQLIALRPDHARYLLVRSDLYLWTKENDKAFADIAAASRLNPISTKPRHALGAAYEYIHEPAKGLAELDAVIARDPDEPQSYRTRGRMNFELGRLNDAMRDFARAVDMDTDAYSVIWLHLTKLKAGAPDLRELRKNMAVFAEETEDKPAKAWPYPVMRFYAGEISEKALISAAESTDSETTRRDQRCEALFYAGMVGWQKKPDAHGTALLNNALSLCPAGFVEYVAAGWELRSVKPS